MSKGIPVWYATGGEVCQQIPSTRLKERLMLPNYPTNEPNLTEPRLASALRKVAWKMKVIGLLLLVFGSLASMFVFREPEKWISAFFGAIQGACLVRAAGAFKQAANENLEESLLEAIKSLNVFFILWALLYVAGLVTAILLVAFHG
jgi:hypothetical protein